MAFVTGSAPDYTELLTALRSACTANGWTLTGNVLSKGIIYINTEVANLSATGNLMPRLLIRASNDSTMTVAHDQRVGLGHYTNVAAQGVQFPCTYDIHIHASPDNVFMVVKYNTNHHQWLGFGNCAVDGLPGTGNFAGGSLSCSLTNSSGTNILNRVTGDLMRCGIGYDGGGLGNQDSTCAALFWNSDIAGSVGHTIHTTHHHVGDLGQGGVWSSRSATYTPAVFHVSNLVRYSPSSWSQEALLIPINPTLKVGNNVYIVGNVVHARYLKINNYTPGDIISYGSDQWKVYPWYIKGTYSGAKVEIADTGTYGWAIRYDGP